MAGESAAFLKQEATRFRKLARDTTDERTLKFLTGLAEEFEAAALAKAAPASPEPPATTTPPDADGRAR